MITLQNTDEKYQRPHRLNSSHVLFGYSRRYCGGPTRKELSDKYQMGCFYPKIPVSGSICYCNINAALFKSQNITTPDLCNDDDDRIPCDLGHVISTMKNYTCILII